MVLYFIAIASFGFGYLFFIFVDFLYLKDIYQNTKRNDLNFIKKTLYNINLINIGEEGLNKVIEHYPEYKEELMKLNYMQKRTKMAILISEGKIQ